MITSRIDVPIAAHGGRAALGPDAQNVTDFSVCLNAFGPADVVRAAVLYADISEYPDPESRLAREAASVAWRRPIEEIAFGAGASELLDAVCRAFLVPGDRVSIEMPAYNEYARAARLSGAVITPDLTSDATLVFVCSPHNPTGAAYDAGQLRALADECAARGSLLVLDQSYDAFVDTPLGTPGIPGHPAVLHLRSLTKDHSLAGVRAAYAVGPRDVIAAMNSARLPWAASTLAQAAAIATFSSESQAHAARTITLLRVEGRRLREACARLGYDVTPSATHFFLLRVASAPRAQKVLLDRARILVRDCTSYGLDDRIRIGARTPRENDQLIDALDRFSSELRP